MGTVKRGCGTAPTALSHTIWFLYGFLADDVHTKQTSHSLLTPRVALRSIFQQRKFTSLDGAAENKGDLKSVVLHSMKLTHIKSSFPMSLGALFDFLFYLQFGQLVGARASLVRHGISVSSFMNGFVWVLV